VAANREFVTYTGTFQGAPISCTSTGIGAPSTSIALEELARCGAKTFIRVGTAGAVQDGIKPGDFVIFDSAMRLDGASKLYAPVEYPAVAHYEVVNAAIEAARELGIRYHVGMTRSADAFYAGYPRPGSSYAGYWQSWWEHSFDDLQRLKVAAAEMEASLIFVLAKIWGLRAGGVSVIIDDTGTESGSSEVFEPDKQLNYAPEYVSMLARLGNEIVRVLHRSDTAAGPEPAG
jgi:uridine phosphorylase